MSEKAKKEADFSKLNEENIKNFKNEDEKFDGKKWVRKMM